MKLSVIIVNYNVKFFLEQCLHSVLKASKNCQVEIFVVDNNSVDGSNNLVKDKFPGIQLIENKTNNGFSCANNQAIKKTSGDYILLLNPDTVVEEDTFTKVIEFMDKTPNAGGLGVKMIDGKGNFLPESKRGLPTPWVAFYKIFGISRIFPKSKKFGKYHLSFLDKNKTHSIEILAGAFMLLRKNVLDKIGLLDETFFMYGEDIDLSYRILKAGYKNYYFPETTIIHYKGESTKKGSLNYVKVFYNAMIIFAKKHFSHGKAQWFSLLIKIAIYFRAIIAICNRVFGQIKSPSLDAALIYLGFILIVPLWENLKYQPNYYPNEFMHIVVPVYILFWLLGIKFSGGYKRPINNWLVIRGLFWGTIAILLAYSLIDERFRFSRALILLGTGWSILILPSIRIILNKLRLNNFQLASTKTKRIAIVGEYNEANRVKDILKQTSIQSEILGFISAIAGQNKHHYIGSIQQLNEIIKINRINELIFCSGTISSRQIIKTMLDLSKIDIDFKIAPPESIGIIGSNSIHTAGELYLINVNSISKAKNISAKRFLDILLSLLFIILYPIVCWFYKNKIQLLKNLLTVFTGKYSLVGFIPGADTHTDLPDLKPGIVNPGCLFPEIELDSLKQTQINLMYAKDYSLLNDLEIISKNLNKLASKIYD